MSTTRSPDGAILVEIADRGVGMADDELADANTRLAKPPAVDVSASRRMGLFVVGRLAARHGISVQLGGAPMGGPGGGLTASVTLPAHLVVSAGDSARQPVAARRRRAHARGCAERRPAAACRRRVRPPLRPADPARGQRPGPVPAAATNGLPTRTPGSSLRREPAPFTSGMADSELVRAAVRGRPVERRGAGFVVARGGERCRCRGGRRRRRGAHRGRPGRRGRRSRRPAAATAAPTRRPTHRPPGRMRGSSTATPFHRPFPQAPASPAETGNGGRSGAGSTRGRSPGAGSSGPGSSGPGRPAPGRRARGRPARGRPAADLPGRGRRLRSRERPPAPSGTGAPGPPGNRARGGRTAGGAGLPGRQLQGRQPGGRQPAGRQAPGRRRSGRRAAAPTDDTAERADGRGGRRRVGGRRRGRGVRLGGGHRGRARAGRRRRVDGRRPAGRRPRRRRSRRRRRCGDRRLRRRRRPDRAVRPAAPPADPPWAERHVPRHLGPVDAVPGCRRRCRPGRGHQRHGPAGRRPAWRRPERSRPVRRRAVRRRPVPRRPLPRRPAVQRRPLRRARRRLLPVHHALPLVAGASASAQSDPFAVPSGPGAPEADAADALFSASVPAIDEPDGLSRTRRPLAETRQGPGPVDMSETTPISRRSPRPGSPRSGRCRSTGSWAGGPGPSPTRSRPQAAPTALDGPHPPFADEWPAAGPSAPPTPGTPAGAPVGAPPAQAFSTEADEGWLAASGAVADRPDELTAAGLPKRRPRARLIPGSAGSAVLAPAVTAARSAESIRGRLASYQQGVRQGRETRLRGHGDDHPATTRSVGRRSRRGVLMTKRGRTHPRPSRAGSAGLSPTSRSACPASRTRSWCRPTACS